MPVSKLTPPDHHAVENPAESRYCSVQLEVDSATPVAVRKSIKVIDHIKTWQIWTTLKWAGIECAY